MTDLRGIPWRKLLVAGALAAVAVVCVVAAMPVIRPVVDRWIGNGHAQAPDPADRPHKDATHDLVRDAEGRPVLPPTLHLSANAARTLDITPETTVAVKAATEPRPLPPLDGTLAYENNGLFPVRPRFGGEVAEITQIPHDPAEQEPDFTKPTPTDWEAKPTRPLDAGDRVKKGQLLAIVWSKDLGDKKAALIDSLIDLRRDEAKLKELEGLWQKGSTSAASVYEAQRTVQKDRNQANAAERTLRMWKLDDKEISEIKHEAATIHEAKRDPRKEMNWARAEVRAPHDGVLVEKNTNLGAWVDPVNGNPMFLIADLSKLAVWAHPLEEYLPALQKLMDRRDSGGLRWKIRLYSEPNAPPLEGPVLRIAPSLDPNQHTLLLMGRIPNPRGRLLVGQFITATILVPPEPGLVEIPTTALNEQDGQSLVFVQPDPKKPEFAVRRLAVADRFKDVIFVRSKLRPGDDRGPAKASLRGPWRVQPLLPGEHVVTRAVPLLTVALRDLIAREDLAVAKK